MNVYINLCPGKVFIFVTVSKMVLSVNKIILRMFNFF